MLDTVLKQSVLQLGHPKVHIQEDRGFPSFDRGFSYVQLYYCTSEGEIVNLYYGDHPILKLNSSSLRFNFSFDGQEAPEDFGKALHKELVSECMRGLKEAGLRIEQGDKAGGRLMDMHHFKIHNEHMVQGLIIDYGATAHRNWFR